MPLVFKEKVLVGNAFFLHGSHNLLSLLHGDARIVGPLGNHHRDLNLIDFEER